MASAVTTGSVALLVEPIARKTTTRGTLAHANAVKAILNARRSASTMRRGSNTTRSEGRRILEREGAIDLARRSTRPRREANGG